MSTEMQRFATKPLLVVGNPADEELLEILRQGFWKPSFLSSVWKASFATVGEAARVGLVCLDRARIGDNLASLVRARFDVDWIALVTAESAAESSVREFIARHCISYQTLPLDRERLLYALGHAAGMRNLLGSANGEARLAEGHFPIVGDSQPIRALRRDLLKIAAVDAPVLLTGESGTGKELAARVIHEQSRRGNNAFVAINCAALSPSLIHAELFGTEKGAFTGAYARRVGQIEAAHRGTVFLDEIGDLDPGLQGLLLRFLEEKSVRRLGGHEEIPVDVRIIAATNVDLDNDVKRGRFREDLYYRLNVIRVRLPPLRNRYEDIPLLAHTFLNRIAADHPRRIDGFSRLALASMCAHDWPGNVRELLNRIRRAAILGEGRLIDAAQLELDQHLAPGIATLERTREEAERLALVRGLSYAQGNAQEAADALGVSRATLYRLLEKHGVAPGANDTSSCL